MVVVAVVTVVGILEMIVLKFVILVVDDNDGVCFLSCFVMVAEVVMVAVVLMAVMEVVFARFLRWVFGGIEIH